MGKIIRQVLVALVFVGALLSVPLSPAQADWVPADVPEQTRFVITGSVADYRGVVFEGGGGWPLDELVLSPVTSASAPAAPHVTDGDAVIDLTLVSWTGYDSEYFWYLLETAAHIRVYGFLAPDPSVPESVRFVADRVEETAAEPNEAEPLSTDIDDALAVAEAVADAAVRAHKITLAWTGNPERCADIGNDCQGVVIGPEFIGSTFNIAMECLADHNWPSLLPGESQVTGRIEIADSNGGELHIALSGTSTYHDAALVLSAFPTLATGQFADANISYGSFVIPSPGFCPWPYDYNTTGAAVGELLLWAGPPA